MNHSGDETRAQTDRARSQAASPARQTALPGQRGGQAFQQGKTNGWNLQLKAETALWIAVLRVVTISHLQDSGLWRRRGAQQKVTQPSPAARSPGIIAFVWPTSHSAIILGFYPSLHSVGANKRLLKKMVRDPSTSCSLYYFRAMRGVGGSTCSNAWLYTVVTAVINRGLDIPKTGYPMEKIPTCKENLWEHTSNCNFHYQLVLFICIVNIQA